MAHSPQGGVTTFEFTVTGEPCGERTVSAEFTLSDTSGSGNEDNKTNSDEECQSPEYQERPVLRRLVCNVDPGNEGLGTRRSGPEGEDDADHRREPEPGTRRLDDLGQL